MGLSGARTSLVRVPCCSGMSPCPDRLQGRAGARRGTGRGRLCGRPGGVGPQYRSSTREVRGASGMISRLPPLRRIFRVRCPRSKSRSSTSAPSASEILRPFSASSETKAVQRQRPSLPRAASRLRPPPAGLGLRPRAPSPPPATGSGRCGSSWRVPPLQPGPLAGSDQDLVHPLGRQGTAPAGSLEHHEGPVGAEAGSLIVQVVATAAKNRLAMGTAAPGHPCCGQRAPAARPPRCLPGSARAARSAGRPSTMAATMARSR